MSNRLLYIFVISLFLLGCHEDQRDTPRPPIVLQEAIDMVFDSSEVTRIVRAENDTMSFGLHLAGVDTMTQKVNPLYYNVVIDRFSTAKRNRDFIVASNISTHNGFSGDCYPPLYTDKFAIVVLKKKHNKALSH